MTKHFYAFGSICRGEVDCGSDVDLLACIDVPDSDLDPQKFSIYTHERISQLWQEGNPFAWHLHLESRLVYTSNGADFLGELGKPCAYQKCREDCEKFYKLFQESNDALKFSKNSAIFHLSCIFLSIRNFATCYSFKFQRPVFSRKSPLIINPKLDISGRDFGLLVRARILSTRGLGPMLSDLEISEAMYCMPVISDWMAHLLWEFKK